MRLAARAQWELDPGGFEVELPDALMGGICLRSPNRIDAFRGIST